MLGTPTVIRPSASVNVGVIGPRGASLRGGTGAPNNSLGFDDDFYFDATAKVIYGPKTSGAWPTPGYSLKGDQGAPGPQILSGGGSPTSSIGRNGDYFVDTAATILYGPKNTGAWPTPGVELIGRMGDIGPTGPANVLTIGTITTLPSTSPATAEITGNAPTQTLNLGLPRGSVIASGSGAPSSSLGVNGDFYVDTAAGALYGPKASGAWPAGLSLIGPAGPTGDGSGNVLGPSSGSVAVGQLAVFSTITGTGLQGGTLTSIGALAIANALSELSSVAKAARASIGASGRARTFFFSQF